MRAIVFQEESKTSQHFHFNLVPEQGTISRICGPARWLSLADLETWQQRKARLIPDDGVINNKRSWVGEEGKEEGYLGTAHVLPSGPQGQTGLRRGKIWHDAPGICDLTFLCESLSEDRRRFLRALPPPLVSKSLDFYQREIWLRAQTVAEQHGVHWRVSVWMGAEYTFQQAKSVLLLHIGRGKPSHLRREK